MLLALLLVLITHPKLSSTLELLEPKCPEVPKLGVLPGLGWDALTSSDMSRVLQLTYDQCKLTNDGKYLIPDGTEAVVIKTKELHLTSELMEHWSNYTTTTAKGFKVGIGFWPKEYLALYASYSEDYKQTKWLQVKYRAASTRIQLRNSLYRIRADPDAALTQSLREQLMQAMRAVSKNQTDKANYLLQVIVRDYGTHYSRSVDAGAVFVKEDFVKSTFIRDHMKEKNKILQLAKVSFFELIDLSWKDNQELDGSFRSQYDENVVDKRVKAIGGPNWSKGISADEWLAGTGDNMVAIDRSGDLLTSLITPAKFPNAPPMLLKNVYEMLGKNIQHYYKYNIRAGCTNPGSPNFDYGANLEDGSCESLVDTHTFGGVYQTCRQLQHRDKYDACARFVKKNELTGDVTCPDEFTSTSLYAQTTNYQFQFNYPKQQCKGFWFWKKCWYNDDYQLLKDKIKVTSYTCIQSSGASVDKATSYRFGGLYSPEVDNIHTKGQKCPPKYRPVHLFYDNRLTVCIRNNIDSSFQYSLPFGGLTSCKTGLRCPSGYHGRLATIIEGCQINYCLHSSVVDLTQAEPLLIQPPFINASKIFDDSENDWKDYDEYGTSLRITGVGGGGETNNIHFGLVASICLMFCCALLCLVYWQRSRMFHYVRQVVSLVSKPRVNNTRQRALNDGVGMGMGIRKGSVANSNAQLMQAWANVTDELENKKNLYRN